VDKFANFSITHARFAGLLIAIIVLGGLYTFATQPRQEDPEITLRGAQVITQFPGMSTERIENLVTWPIEDKIKEISEIDEIKSVSMPGLSIVTPRAHDRYYDMEPIWNKLRNKMDDIRPTLPEGAVGPQVNDDFGRVAVITLALTGTDYEMAELNEIARDIRDSLGALPLVSQVDLYGVQEERIWLEYDANALSQFDLSPSTVVAALRGQNVVLPGGTVNASGQSVVVEPTGDFRSVEDIRNLAIGTSGDSGIVYLQDIATIERGYVDPPQSPAFYNNQPAIVIGISMVDSSNVVEVGHQVNAALQNIKPLLPAGMQLDTAIFQPDLVQASVNNASNNLLQTMIVVLVVVMVFLGWRTGLIVGAMVPLTMMATLMAMSVGGIELHRISIAAIIVALGLLVDNGVVIAEDISQRLERGSDRLAASLAAAGTLAIPLLTSSLTTIIAFLPLALIDDSSGEFLRSLGQVLAIALLISWFLAISVTPALCYWFLPDAEPGDSEAESEPAQGAAYDFYQKLLTLILRRRAIFMLLMLGLLFAAGQVFQFVKERSLGPSERNQFTVYVDLPSIAHISETLETTQTLVSFLNDETRNPEVTDVLSYVGGGGPRFFLALAPNDPQPNKAFLVVTTEQADQIDTVMERVEGFLLTDLPQASGRADILFLGDAPIGTVEFRVRGPDMDVLRVLGDQIKEIFYNIPGSRSVRSDWEDPVLKLYVEVDQERARRAEVTSQEIAETLTAIFDGQVVTHYREREKVIPVMLRARPEHRKGLDTLRSTEVFSESRGMPVPILQVADTDGGIEPSRIRRFNQERALTIAGKHPQMTALELYEVMQDSIAALDIPPGHEIEVEGEVKDAAESNEKLMGFAPHALLLIVLLLVLQFNSFRRPLIILLTIPLVIIGANFGLAVFNAYFDFTAMLGLFSLAGIIINNGIVMIDRIDRGRESGLDVDDAVIGAALARARPIIMTTITTVIGLLPLALFGGEFWFGMAIVIMCGLGLGTILTLGFIPVLYSLMFNNERKPVSNGS
jgi:multidrug efflux pump subunit AcrB